MAVLGILPVVQSQLAHETQFAAAFAYLAQALKPGSPEHTRILAVKTGATERIELTGGAFALEQAYVSKPRAEGKYESHRKYIDLQAILAGEEWMEFTHVSRLVLKDDFSAERDVLFYQDLTAGSRLRVGPGEVAVFFPADAHMPSLAIAAPALVYKTVVKVPVRA
ncbi:MAG TPA: YhcH/YjgK/YiaL family protein [Opitutaceae bacterium]